MTPVETLAAAETLLAGALRPIQSHNLCLRYARYYNRRYGRTGHVFGRRYAAILIDADRYLHGLVRFVREHRRSGSVPSQIPYTTGSPTDRRFLGDDAFIQRSLLAARPLR